MLQAVVKTTDLTKKFGQQVAVENINIEIHKGEIYGLMGRNGAGKTTFLRLLTSLLKQTSGEIMLFGKPLSIEKLERTASVIDTPVAYDNMSAYDNLKYYCIEQGILDYTIIDEVLVMVNLADTGKKKFKDFSLGMRQRLGIAIAILGQPDFLILDEPINGLDPIAIIEFRELMLRLNREYNMTILIASHILTELYHIATKFGIMHEGRLIAEITKDNFEQQCQESVTLKVDKLHAASILIAENYRFSVKVISQHELRIFDANEHDAADINVLLVNHGIRVEKIEVLTADLETYFAELIATKT